MLYLAIRWCITRFEIIFNLYFKIYCIAILRSCRSSSMYTLYVHTKKLVNSLQFHIQLHRSCHKISLLAHFYIYNIYHKAKKICKKKFLVFFSFQGILEITLANKTHNKLFISIFKVIDIFYQASFIYHCDERKLMTFSNLVIIMIMSWCDFNSA